MHLMNDELALFAEMLDEYSHDPDLALLRDRIETHLYLAGHWDRIAIEPDGQQWRVVSPDGSFEVYGLSPLEALQEYKRQR